MSEASMWELFVDDLDPAPIEVPNWNPQPKQEIAWKFASEVSEMLYGGAAGGGKSYFIAAYMVWYALTYPGSHIGLVRATLGAIMETHHIDTFPIFIEEGMATFNGTDKFWRFRNGSILRYVYMDNEKDAQKRKSAQYDLLVFDEVTEQKEANYTYLITRLRSTKDSPKGVICTGNPEGAGFAWVKRRFVAPKEGDLAPGQKSPESMEVWYPPIAGNSEKKGLSRIFIPATVYDNHKLMEMDPDYVTRLESLPDPRLRKALLEGDWNAMDNVMGAYWSHSLIEQFRVNTTPDAIKRVLAIDPAVTSNEKSDHTGIILTAKAMVDLPDPEQDLDALAGRKPKKKRAHYYVEKDLTCRVPSDQWAKVAVRTAYDSNATILVEVDQGGDVWASQLKNAAKALGISCPPIVLRRAGSIGSKATRANPVAALYIDGRVHHVGHFIELEEEMTTWVPEKGHDSPDRMDALVWSILELDRPGVVPVRARRLS